MEWYSVYNLAIAFSTFTLHELVWFGSNAFYIYIDAQKLFESDRISEYRVTINEQISIFDTLISNHLMFLFPLQLISIPIFEWSGIYFDLNFFSKMSWFGIVLHLLIFDFVEDAIFYWVHRLMHVPFFYKKIHYKHHEFDSFHGTTFSLNGEYAHILENFFNDLVPLLAGPLLCGMVEGTSIVVFWIWMAYRQIRSADAHSNYDLPYHPLRLLRPFYKGSRKHILHHSLKGRKYNFGTYWFWDYIMQTSSE